MARTWFRSKQLTRQTLTGTTTPASVLSLSFNYEASTDYYLIWSMQSDYSVTSRSAAFALNDTTGATGLAAISNRTTSTSDVFSVGGIAKWTAPGSAGSRQFDITQAPTNTADTVGSDEIFLMAIKKDATDQYAELLTADNSTTSTLATRATMTFTPATSGDYLILFSAEVGGLITSTVNGSCRVLLDVNGSTYFDTVDGQQANTSGARYAWAGALVVNLAASSQTISIKYSSPDNTNTANIRNTRILAMRLDTFAQSSTAQSSSDQTTQATTFQTANTISPTAGAYDYMVLGTGIIRYSTSARGGQWQVSVGGVTRSLMTRFQMSQSGVRKTAYIGFGYDTIAAGSVTILNQWKAANASDTAYIQDGFIGAFLMSIAPHSYTAVLG